MKNTLIFDRILNFTIEALIEQLNQMKTGMQAVVIWRLLAYAMRAAASSPDILFAARDAPVGFPRGRHAQTEPSVGMAL